MKQLPHRNIGTYSDAGRSPHGTRKSGEVGMHANRRRTPPAVPHRRYPSLSDDGQPWFPRAPWSRRPENQPPAAGTSPDDHRSEFPYVRAIALLGIVAIIAALVANA